MSKMKRIHGNQSKSLSSTTTMAPPIASSQTAPINSSAETTDALSMTVTDTPSAMPKKPHGNTKYTFPYWKTCKVCSKPFPTFNRTQALRNKTCSQECRNAIPHKKKPPEERVGLVLVACAVCGKEVWKPRAWVKRTAAPTCSRACNGILRGAEWKQHAHKGRAAWTAASEASYRVKMSGENNPAWKGGVTYFKTHGNYQGVRYVRCPPEFASMARKDGYVMEHRLVVARALGRPLLRSEVVHHLDHDPANNEPSNLLLFDSNRAHKLWEHHGSPAPIWPA